jgi:Fe-S cluster biogenesis protein NfuA
MSAAAPENPRSQQAPAMPRTSPGRPRAETIRQRVERILDLIRPAVQSDDGDVELVDVTDDGVVRVRFHGACVGCPSSSVTLQALIERSLKQHVPQVKEVQSVA